MIEYLILLLMVKYRDGFSARVVNEPDEMDWHLKCGAGLDWVPPERDNVIPLRRDQWQP